LMTSDRFHCCVLLANDLSGLSVGNWSFGCTIQLLFQVNSPMAFDQISSSNFVSPKFNLSIWKMRISMSLSLRSTFRIIRSWAVNLWK
jgi:hypothetical protein